MNNEKEAVDKILVGTGAATATVSARQDMTGYRHATIRVLINKQVNTSANAMTLSLLHSDDTVVSNYVTLTADKAPVPASGATEQRYEVDMRGKKRYLRLVITPGTHTSNDIQGAIAIATLSRAENAPSAESALVDSSGTVTVI